MNWIDRLQALAFRLFAACLAFWLAGAALDSVWLIQLMGACGFAGLAVIDDIGTEPWLPQGSVPTVRRRD